jgi:CheY-like chemotaxis protein
MSKMAQLRMIERDGVSAMAHVLVFYDEPSIAMLLAVICEEEGHAVTKVHSVEDALMVLRSSLHPMIALCERDHSSHDPAGPFFVTIRDHPELYGQHRYVAFTSWNLSDDERALLDEVGAPLISVPFTSSQLIYAIATTGLA